MQRNRMLIIMLCITALLGVYTVRLFSIQMMETVRYKDRAAITKQSIDQRSRGIVLNDGRAQIVDRNGEALTGDTVYSVVFFPEYAEHFRGNSRNISSTLSTILQRSTNEWEQWALSLQHPAIWRSEGTGEPIAITKEQADSINKLQVPGLLSVPISKRYKKPYIAQHVIGFIGEHPERVQELYEKQLASGKLSLRSRIGAAGLEKTLDSWMQGIGEETILSFVDANGRPIEGMSIRKLKPNNPFYPLQIVTTLDKSIQQNIEQMVDEQQLDQGAVVVLDAHSADIIAMVSRPAFDPNHLGTGIDNWRNRAVKAAVPGSIFKTVTAAAALEYRLAEGQEHFHCGGHFGKYKFTCWNKSGHGMLTLREAYAQSCNITFAHLAERLTGEQITTTALKLGLLQRVGPTIESLSQDEAEVPILDGEEAGVIFSNPRSGDDEGIRIQSAIGQRDVMLSPLQAANMVVTLLGDGEVKRPRIVKQIRYQTGDVRKKIEQETLVKRKDGISARTAAQIRSWMRDVVTSGTGKSLSSLTWNVAGKSGTAQIGNTSKENEWFIGYGPFENPRYAVAVLVEKTEDTQGHKATDLFGKVMEILAEK